jgi:hypothetical protein
MEHRPTLGSLRFRLINIGSQNVVIAINMRLLISLALLMANFAQAQDAPAQVPIYYIIHQTTVQIKFNDVPSKDRFWELFGLEIFPTVHDHGHWRIGYAKAVIKQMIKPDLKAAFASKKLQAYFASADQNFAQIEIMQNGIAADIDHSKIKIKQHCYDDHGEDGSGATTQGVPGSDICLSPSNILKGMGDWNSSEATDRIMAVAIHEYARHFDIDDSLHDLYAQAEKFMIASTSNVGDEVHSTLVSPEFAQARKEMRNAGELQGNQIGKNRHYTCTMVTQHAPDFDANDFSGFTLNANDPLPGFYSWNFDHPIKDMNDLPDSFHSEKTGLPFTVFDKPATTRNDDQQLSIFFRMNAEGDLIGEMGTYGTVDSQDYIPSVMIDSDHLTVFGYLKCSAQPAHTKDLKSK